MQQALYYQQLVFPAYYCPQPLLVLAPALAGQFTSELSSSAQNDPSQTDPSQTEPYSPPQHPRKSLRKKNVTKNFLTNVARMLWKYLSLLGIEQKQPFNKFFKSNYKTMADYTTLFTELLDEDHSVLQKFFEGTIIRYMMVSKISSANLRRYTKMLPLLLSALKRKRLSYLKQL